MTNSLDALPAANDPARFITRLVTWISAHRWWLVIGATLLTAVAWQPSNRLTFDRSIENLFAADDPLLDSFARLKRVFGRHEIVMIIYEDEQLMQSAGQERIRRVTAQVRRSPGVASVLSLASIPGLASDRGEGRIAALRQIFERYTHGPDQKTAAVVTMLAPQDTRETPLEEVLDHLHDIANDLPRGAVIGEPVLIDESFAMLQDDGRRLLTWSALLLALTMLLSLRRLRWVLCAAGVVAFAVVTTRAIVSLSGMRLSLVSTMLPAIITVIGVATVMHLAIRCERFREDGLTARQGLHKSLVWLLAPIAWTCATDAGGFASLMISSVGPVRDFGWMMIVGSLIIIPSVLAIGPAIATARWPTSQPTQRPSAVEGAAASSGRHVSRSFPGSDDAQDALPGRPPHTRRRHTLTVLGAIGLTCIAATGTARLQVETDFTRNFRADSPIVGAYAFVEDSLGGAGVWDIVLPAPPQLNYEYLARVRAFEERLRREAPRLAKTLSLADAVHALSGDTLTSDLAVTASATTMKALMPHFYTALYNVDPAHPDRHFLRVMLRAPERLPVHEKLKLIARVEQITKDTFPEAEVTGYYVLLANLVTSLNRDQWLSLLLATACVFCMMMAAFRSASLAAIVVFVNGLPVLIVFGTLGWLAIPLNMGGAMSAAVSLGLAVDASIHYVTAFRRAHGNGMSTQQANQVSLATVGRPVVLSTIALVVGLLTLCGSEFVPTVHFGILVSATMVGGLIGNLVLLPSILSKWNPAPRCVRGERSLR